MGIVTAQEAEVFPNLSFRIAVGVRASGRQTVLDDFRPIRRRPEVIGIRQHAWLEIRNRGIYAGRVRKKALASLGVRHNCSTRYSPPLAKSFIVSEQKRLVLLQRTSQCPTELIAFEGTLG